MQYLSLLKNLGPVSKVRRNHALEHATLQVLAEKKITGSMAGLSDMRGFWVFGDVDSEVLVKNVEEARERLIGGEHTLAIHPNCGTNFAVAGIISGFLAWLAMLGVQKNWQDRFDRLGNVITFATLGLILAQPLGPKVQQMITTDANIETLHPVEVLCFKERTPPVHRVLTSG
jgi:hypothetical protein